MANNIRKNHKEFFQFLKVSLFILAVAIIAVLCYYVINSTTSTNSQAAGVGCISYLKTVDGVVSSTIIPYNGLNSSGSLRCCKNGGIYAFTAVNSVVKNGCQPDNSPSVNPNTNLGITNQLDSTRDTRGYCLPGQTQCAYSYMAGSKKCLSPVNNKIWFYCCPSPKIKNSSSTRCINP